MGQAGEGAILMWVNPPKDFPSWSGRGQWTALSGHKWLCPSGSLILFCFHPGIDLTSSPVRQTFSASVAFYFPKCSLCHFISLWQGGLAEFHSQIPGAPTTISDAPSAKAKPTPFILVTPQGQMVASVFLSAE